MPLRIAAQNPASCVPPSGRGDGVAIRLDETVARVGVQLIAHSTDPGRRRTCPRSLTLPGEGLAQNRSTSLAQSFFQGNPTGRRGSGTWLLSAFHRHRWRISSGSRRRRTGRPLDRTDLEEARGLEACGDQRSLRIGMEGHGGAATIGGGANLFDRAKGQAAREFRGSKTVFVSSHFHDGVESESALTTDTPDTMKATRRLIGLARELTPRVKGAQDHLKRRLVLETSDAGPSGMPRPLSRMVTAEVFV